MLQTQYWGSIFLQAAWAAHFAANTSGYFLRLWCSPLAHTSGKLHVSPTTAAATIWANPGTPPETCTTGEYYNIAAVALLGRRRRSRQQGQSGNPPGACTTAAAAVFFR